MTTRTKIGIPIPSKKHEAGLYNFYMSSALWGGPLETRDTYWCEFTLGDDSYEIGRIKVNINKDAQAPKLIKDFTEDCLKNGDEMISSGKLQTHKEKSKEIVQAFQNAYEESVEKIMKWSHKENREIK